MILKHNLFCAGPLIPPNVVYKMFSNNQAFKLILEQTFNRISDWGNWTERSRKPVDWEDLPKDNEPFSE